MRMEEQRFESAYLLLRMVICQLVRQTLRKNHPKSLTDSDRWVVLPFDIKICLFFIQTRKKLPKQCVYIYIYTYIQYIIYVYVNIYVYIYTHQIHIKSTSAQTPPHHPYMTFFRRPGTFLWYLHTIRIQEPPDLSHLRPQAWLGRGGSGEN